MSAALSSASTYRTPFEIADRFLDRAPVDLDGMAAALGVSVKRDARMQPGISGHITRVRDGYEIAVNAADAPARQRFTLAHEIAHYLLHRELLDGGIEDDRMYRSRLGGIVERQANRLAAQLLMPANLVRFACQAGATDVGRLARTFGVSEQAMDIRLRELGLNRA